MKYRKRNYFLTLSLSCISDEPTTPDLNRTMKFRCPTRKPKLKTEIGRWGVERIDENTFFSLHCSRMIITQRKSFLVKFLNRLDVSRTKFHFRFVVGGPCACVKWIILGNALILFIIGTESQIVSAVSLSLY